MKKKLLAFLFAGLSGIALSLSAVSCGGSSEFAEVVIPGPRRSRNVPEPSESPRRLPWPSIPRRRLPTRWAPICGRRRCRRRRRRRMPRCVLSSPRKRVCPLRRRGMNFRFFPRARWSGHAVRRASSTGCRPCCSFAATMGTRSRPSASSMRRASATGACTSTSRATSSARSL